jgi:hypothetical protein
VCYQDEHVWGKSYILGGSWGDTTGNGLCLTVRVVDEFDNMGSVPGYRKATEISLVGIGAAECLGGNQLTHRSSAKHTLCVFSFRDLDRNGITAVFTLNLTHVMLVEHIVGSGSLDLKHVVYTQSCFCGMPSRLHVPIYAECVIAPHGLAYDHQQDIICLHLQ